MLHLSDLMDMSSNHNNSSVHMHTLFDCVYLQLYSFQSQKVDRLITTMDTPYTLRATHLKDLYETITMKTLAKNERLDILLTLKATVREHNCKLTREIVELVDREADLLVRDTKPSALMGLRKRIATLFQLHLYYNLKKESL
ncbi:PREDICTED: IQ and ubiquitin-like domain-containing protein [Amphimedon queenslandica]|uniref:IQ motif and ubiquitin-like domain-containing protein n=1 Tax=Amphimedon queenslandica TaxID=400682 RepID=A0AAN0JU68_AMPQE|nr:PREDICTED: IQ and ubiquitin-like domain-containing protein [Amphimedon queenslandica]|eukprot:XP_019860686.1 PREDICTED: IQ and ubiquitin-like domain-containing protein [Amphimedon queenslandica]